MKLKMFVLPLMLFIFSCKEKDQKHELKDGKSIDSSVYYSKDNSIKEIRYQLKNGYSYAKFLQNNLVSSEGNFYKTQKIGNWKYYNYKGKLDKTMEYIDSCGVQYLNQGWYYDKNGKLIKSKSNFYNINLKNKKYALNEVIDIRITYNPIINKDSKSFVCLSTELESNYCNLNTVKLDTAYSNNNDFYIKMSFTTKGKKNIRGYIREYYNPQKQLLGERTVFFNIPLVVE